MISVVLKGFMSHDSSSFELPDRGVVVVTGPNGAGKSAIVEAFAIALWGRGTRSTRWQPWRSEPGLVTVDDGQLIATRRWTGKTKSLSWGLKSAEAATYDTTSKAQDGLTRVVGDFEAWRRTCVFSSADAAHFTLATDAERKELLEGLLGLGWFDTALAFCRRDLNTARATMLSAERERDLLVSKADGAARLVKQATDLLAQTTDPGGVGTLRAELSRIDGFLRAAESDLRVTQAEMAKLLGVGGEALGRSREIRARLQRLTGDECFTCGQPITEELRASLEAEAEEQLRESVRRRGENLAAVEALQADADEASEQVRSLQAMRQDLGTKVNNISRQRDLRERLRAEAESAGQEVLRLGQQVLAMRERLATATVDVAELEACERVLGVRGARALLVGRTLSGIEGLANTWMSRLGSSIEIKLKPYTERKSGASVDAISLGLVGAGGEDGYAGASAGERRRVDVAILLALSELADGAAQQGTWRSPVFFDEVFDGLDEDGKDAVMETVQQVAQERLVVVITHSDRLAGERADLRLRVDAGRVT